MSLACVSDNSVRSLSPLMTHSVRLSALFLALCSQIAWGQQPVPAPGCRVSFSVVYLDRLNNQNTGVPEKSLKDIEKRISRFHDLCYVPDASGKLVFFVHTNPAVYHGTHVYRNSSTAAAAASSDSGAAAAAATSTSTTAVPYQVDYSVFILDIELPKPDGTYQILHTFDQKGLYNTIYGIGYGKGKHPIPVVIEAAADWTQTHLPAVTTAMIPQPASPVTQAPASRVVPASVGISSGVAIDANIPNCDIEVDGEFVGNTPSAVTLTPGKHQITVEKTGYQNWTRTMTFIGGTVHLNAELAHN